MLFATVFACFVLVVSVRGDAGPYGEGEDMIFTPTQLKLMQSRSAVNWSPPWTAGKVPYVMDPSFSSSSYHTTALQNSINLLNNKTCIRLTPRTNESYYLNFINTGPTGGCSSNIGMVGAAQPVKIADWCTGKPYTDGTRSSWYSTLHEIIHALGFMHEQCRPDRDSFVKVYLDNPTAQNNINYQKIPVAESLIFSQYDYDSVMHYPGQIGLLETLDPKLQNAIGQRDHVSDCDIAKVNRYYKCPSTYQQTACPVDATQPPTTPPTTTPENYYYYYYY